MIDQTFHRLEDVIASDLFPDVDVELRRGHHIDRDRIDWYEFLTDAQGLLEQFYRRYGYKLIHADEGFFYLIPVRDSLSRRQLTPAEMLSGQGLALLYLDPASVRDGGVIARDQLIELIANLVGEQPLIQALNPRRKRRDEKVEQAQVRHELNKALRTLARLGFIDLHDDDRIQLRSPVLRFAEPVRGLRDPREALADLVARGHVVLNEEDASDSEDDAP